MKYHNCNSQLPTSFWIALYIIMVGNLTSCKSSLMDKNEVLESTTPFRLHEQNVRDITNTTSFNPFNGTDEISEKEYYKALFKDQDELNQLEYKMLTRPKKAAYYKQKLQDKVDEMYRQREDRGQARKQFLQQFYTDLYQLPEADFTQKYRRTCSADIVRSLRAGYEATHGGQKGQYWGYFTDGLQHNRINLRIILLSRKDRTYVGERAWTYIYPEEGSYAADKGYPYAERDAMWYAVDIGSEPILVKVEGEGKGMMITGIYNAHTGISIK